MARKAVIDAVEARLAANWTRCPVRGVNRLVGDTPIDGSALLTVQYPVAVTEQITVGAPGSNVFREEGALRLILNVKRGTGSTVFDWADELARLFRAKTFDGVRTYAPSSPVVTDDNEEGTRFVLSIAVPFDHDELG